MQYSFQLKSDVVLSTMYTIDKFDQVLGEIKFYSTKLNK